MVRIVPHYLLFTESFIDHRRACGCWRFTLREIDGTDSLDVIENEPGVDGERLELLSVLRGLEALDQPSSVTIVTPSRYVSRGFRFGMEEWRESNWCWERFGVMQPIKNCDLWQRIDRALQFHSASCRCWSLENATRLMNSRALQQADRPHGKKPVASPFSLNRISNWGRQKIAALADTTKNWALNHSENELEQNQFA